MERKPRQNLLELLEVRQATIVADADAALARAQLPHYQHARAGVSTLRIGRLYALVLLSLRTHSLVPVVEHAEHVARERLAEGYATSEIQTKLDVLETTIRRHVAAELEPTSYAKAMGQIGAAFRACREALASTTSALAGEPHTAANHGVG